MRGVFDWLSRLVMLVLAGMVTLSIIGAIASIPSGSIGTRIGFERAEQPVPVDAVPGDEVAEAVEQLEGNTTAAGAQTTVSVAAAAPPERQAEDWLEAITYALIALAGLAGLGCLILWRSLHRQSRIADALETLASRRDPL